MRDGVEVRSGDPGDVAAVAAALEFEHKYTSGVIARVPEDRPTDAHIEAMLDVFRNALDADCTALAEILRRRWS